MSQCLHPCPSCAQHVRAGETACPFCGAALEARACEKPAGARPLSRAAILFVGATAAAACGGSESTGGGNGDAATDANQNGDGSTDGPVALYGPAPVDGGMDASDSGSVVLYGPAPVDGGAG